MTVDEVEPKKEEAHLVQTPEPSLSNESDDDTLSQLTSDEEPSLVKLRKN